MAQTISLVPQQADLKLYSGDRAAIRLLVEGGDVDLSTGVLLAQIKTSRADSTAKATFDVAINADGSALLSLTGGDTTALGSFSGVWDCQWTPPGGEPVTVVQGKVSCVLDVSR
jgi:hypothetical protein